MIVIVIIVDCIALLFLLRINIFCIIIWYSVVYFMVMINSEDIHHVHNKGYPCFSALLLGKLLHEHLCNCGLCSSVTIMYVVE